MVNEKQFDFMPKNERFILPLSRECCKKGVVLEEKRFMICRAVEIFLTEHR